MLTCGNADLWNHSGCDNHKTSHSIEFSFIDENVISGLLKFGIVVEDDFFVDEIDYW